MGLEQPSLFDLPDMRIEFEVRPGNRKGWVVAMATVFDDDDMPIIHLEGQHKNARFLRGAYLQTAREALILNSARPFGDDYHTDLCRVVYLMEW